MMMLCRIIMGDIVEAKKFMEDAAKKMINRSFAKAADFYQNAGLHYESLNLWVEAAEAFLKVAECRLLKVAKCGSESSDKHFAALAYVQAAYHYKSVDDNDKAISCLEKAVRQFETLKMFDQAARFCKVTGEWYENQSNWEGSICFFKKAANHFHHGKNDAETECREKVKELNDKKNGV
ncbi:alpha-soluble NSF attachment protein 2-like isoform X2 [Papaver somniferum]|uniref:alpha-soluble NSF attachment protein 2-like isoform X2 n=1 Tax=Papaver somniferum TaxID=3469 RepID=UPI000E6FE3A9|nr:alpha-soluble NSF attachment protein 2-like isoform X2 [Papaver somniferum]XP_026453809.1 alpha-soluble NSF attachment protein 2-like isoform X2 [Papaver somniferum]